MEESRMRMTGYGGLLAMGVRAVVVLLLLCVGSAAHAGKRVALVIGNSAYQHSGELANTRNDATDMAAALRAHGFQVIDGFDLDKPAFERKVRDFAAALVGAEVGLFFYAGHGMQVSGQNYLVPVDAQLKAPSALDFEMVRLDLVQRTMEREAPTNILFLDACRDNPLAPNLARAMGTRSTDVGRGLAAAESGIGTLISFSTQPGNVALDGAGRNSPFAGALLKQLTSSNDDLSAILIAVRNDVMRETQRRQVPWEHSALTGRFYFSPGAGAPAAQPSAPVPAPPPPAIAALPPQGAVRAQAIIAGAGALFPYPVYALWSEAYKKEGGVGLSYQSVGSRGGIRQIQTGTAVFGATDVPLQVADLQRDALVQFPTVMGGVVVIVNVDGVKAGELTLDGPILARIFLGEIKSWNDPAIQRLNPALRLPSQPIVAVHRSDDSATSYVLTHYLSKISSDWRLRVGANTAVQWPAGLGARGNDGIANTVAQTKGAIGYAEYAYARHNNLTFARLVNRDGRAVAPNAASLMAAASNANWEATPGFGVILTDTSGAESWPMASASFVVMRKQPDDPAMAREALKFFAWAFANGDRLAEQLLYAPMPDNVVGAIQRLWAAEIRDASGRPLLARPN
jgi:phosphate transport system substrate-binding protein